MLSLQQDGFTSLPDKDFLDVGENGLEGVRPDSSTSAVGLPHVSLGDIPGRITSTHPSSS